MSALHAAVTGRPLGHSRSPLLHSTAYSLLGVDIDYTRIESGEEGAQALAQRLRTEPGWVGLSVTMPMKQPMLAQMDSVDPVAAALGALNTVVVTPDPEGRGYATLHGLNTDVLGVSGALRAAGVDGVGPATPLVIGAGGTAAAALAGLAELGATSATVAVREPARAAGLVEIGARLGVSVDVISLTSVTRLGKVSVAVSTLPPRAADPWAEDLAALAAPGAVLLDVAYDPWPSALGAAWERAGGRVVHGLAMLVHQAVEQIALFTGLEAARSAVILGALCDAADILPDGTARGPVAG